MEPSPAQKLSLSTHQVRHVLVGRQAGRKPLQQRRGHRPRLNHDLQGRLHARLLRGLEELACMRAHACVCVRVCVRACACIPTGLFGRAFQHLACMCAWQARGSMCVCTYMFIHLSWSVHASRRTGARPPLERVERPRR